MSNLTIFSSGAALPSYLKTAEMDETTKNLAGGSGSGGGKRISIRGNVFRLLVNGEELMVNEDRSMNIVIVGASPIGRQFYEGTYDAEAAPKAPTCWAPDGTKPSPQAADPQASTCMSCPQNVIGSGQGDSRACRYQQRLAVVLEGDLSGDVYQLPIPSTSIFGNGENGQKLPMQAYARFMAQNKIPVRAVVTEMRFDTSSATPKLTFRAVRPLTEEEYQECVEQGNSEEAKRAITMTVASTDGVKDTSPGGADEPFEQPKVIEPPKPTKPKAAKPAPAPAPVEEDEADEEVEAPVVADPEPTKVTKTKEEPLAKSALTDLIDEWDE